MKRNNGKTKKICRSKFCGKMHTSRKRLGMRRRNARKATQSLHMNLEN